MILFWVYAAVHFLDEKVMVLVQIWRMIDLIYRPEEEVLAELDSFKSHILTCSSWCLFKKLLKLSFSSLLKLMTST